MLFRTYKILNYRTWHPRKIDNINSSIIPQEKLMMESRVPEWWTQKSSFLVFYFEIFERKRKQASHKAYT
jgi:hypothetical protein